MKKMLSILSTLVLTGSAAIGLTNTINSNQIKLNNSGDQIDWNYIKNNNGNYFSNFKNNFQKKLQPQFSTKDIYTAIAYAQKKADDYTTIFQNKNFNLNQIIEFLSNENFAKILTTLLISAATTATATSWAFPAVLAIIPIISAITTWIRLYKKCHKLNFLF